MILHLTSNNCFWLSCSFEERDIPRKAGFLWDSSRKIWHTSNKYVAVKFYKYADAPAKNMLNKNYQFINQSFRINPFEVLPIPQSPQSLKYLPFQLAGIQLMTARFNGGFKSLLLADPMGLGKTIQALGIIKELNIHPSRILIVCPAGLRINWANEALKWIGPSYEPQVITTKKDKLRYSEGPTIISYTLLKDIPALLSLNWALTIFDEAHNIKNKIAKRTRICLGDKKTPGLIFNSNKVLFITGTPIPNRPHEFHGMLDSTVPEVIDYMKYYRFCNRFCIGILKDGSYTIVGAKNQAELFARLRGSGWMIRRYKSEVLPDLPPKRFNLIVFPQDKRTSKIVEKESAFDPEEIIKHGVPVRASAVPELRHEMALAKLDQCVYWVKNQLETTKKLVIFAHHRDVIDLLTNQLSAYNPAVIHGGRTDKQREAAKLAFQTDKGCRVFIGQIKAAGEGITLTAAADVVFVESSWVSGEIDQDIDRVHRIGQKADSINIYFLVVEKSLDATILSRAAEKAVDLHKILDDKGLVETSII